MDLLDKDPASLSIDEIRLLLLMHYEADLHHLVDHEQYVKRILNENNQVDDQIARIMNLKKERRQIEKTTLKSAIDIETIMNMNVWVHDKEQIDFDFSYLDICEPVSTESVFRTSLPIQSKSSSVSAAVKEPPVKSKISSISAAVREPEPAKIIPAKRTHEGPFMTARDVLDLENKKQGKPKLVSKNPVSHKRPAFVSPLLSKKKKIEEETELKNEDERFKNLVPVLVETITNEIMGNVETVTWDDIAGLSHAKKTIKEIVVFPMLRPDIFCGLRAPPKGLLLFGPPGTGKTLIGKCIASQCKATFFSISSSSLTSKWVGEGEKLVRTLFAVARVKQPSVIFIDEIDSLLTQRTDGEQEGTRRIKTEFLVQFDGCGTNNEDRILMIGATNRYFMLNRPQEIDEAARRRFRKKLYIPLPDYDGRKSMLVTMLGQQKHDLTEANLEEIVKKTEGYSGSDMDGLIRESSLGPIRDIMDISSIKAEDVRGISFHDFFEALDQVKASVSERDLDLYKRFELEFGSMG